MDNIFRDISENCIECNICVKQCAFLKKYGTPKFIADSYSQDEQLEFECSLCSLCTAVCPVDVDPQKMFLEMRRYAVASDNADLKKQKLLINYEKRGTSKLYSFYGLPQGCDTVFFPGCALAGSRSKRVLQLYDHLQETFPALGIVLDCCTKPSHDLGRKEYFSAMFTEMHEYLSGRGIKRVLTACPSCYAIFAKYADKLITQSVYEILATQDWQVSSHIPDNPVTVQDSCVARFQGDIQESSRTLIKARGIQLEEMKHHGKKTLCCGEGGGAHFVAPELAGRWGETRRVEAGNKCIVTYCAGCANFLGKTGQTAHLLDLIFDPEATLQGRVKITKSPLTYFWRLYLKYKLKNIPNYSITRERDFNGMEAP